MKELIEKIEAIYTVFKTNAEAQAENGNRAAGTRARKAALDIAMAMKEFRKVSVQESNK